MNMSPSEPSDQTAPMRSNENSEVVAQKPFAEPEQKAKPKIEMDAERIRSSITRLTSNSIGELEGLAAELQKLDEFIKFETERVHREIESLLAGIKIIVETISLWKRPTTSAATISPSRAVFAGRTRDDARRTPAGA